MKQMMVLAEWREPSGAINRRACALPLLAGNRTLISRAVLSHGEVRAIELPSVYFDPFQLPKAISVQSGVEGRYAKNYR